MNRFGKRYLALICSALVTITGCGGSTQAPAEDASTAEESTEATEETSVEETSAEETEAEEASAGETEAEDIETETETEDTEAEEETVAATIPAADEEAYKDIISGLSEDDYVAAVDLGKDNDFLITATGDFVFDNLDGNMAATEGELYGINADGEVVDLGYLEGGGTATPLAYSGDVLYYANHTTVTAVTVNDDISGIETTESESFDDYGNATVIGFASVKDLGSAGSSSDITELPPYEYPDKNSIYYEVCRYLVDEIGSKQYEKAGVCIPYCLEVGIDESNPDDILLYGDYWVYNYDLDGETLVTVSGGNYPGLMHIKKSDGKYEVTAFDVVEDGSDNDKSTREIFGDYYDRVIELMGDEEANASARGEYISEYVLANELPITQYQDYGWDPVALSGDGGYYGPEDFLQEQSGKTAFTDYDDVIANLKSGQGYAKFTLYGCDLEFLAVTEQVFEANKSAAEASVYADTGSGASMCTLVTGNGSSYPLRIEDGILYGGDNHNYLTYFAFENEDTVGIMQKDCVSDGDGAGEYSGFLREDNEFDSETEFTGGQEEFEKLISEREEKPILEFTVVE